MRRSSVGAGRRSRPRGSTVTRCGRARATSPPASGQADQRAALDLDASAGRGPVGRAGLGVAVLDGAGALGALQPDAGSAPQDVAGVGAADDPTTAPLAARS